MAEYGKRLLFEPLRSIESDDVPAAYSIAATLFTVGGDIALLNPARVIMIDNFSDKNMVFSFDGVNDHFVVHAESSKVLDIGSNKQGDGAYFLGKGEVLYIKYEDDAPTAGTLIYYSVIYAKGD